MSKIEKNKFEQAKEGNINPVQVTERKINSEQVKEKHDYEQLKERNINYE